MQLHSDKHFALVCEVVFEINILSIDFGQFLEWTVHKCSVSSGTFWCEFVHRYSDIGCASEIELPFHCAWIQSRVLLAGKNTWWILDVPTYPAHGCNF